MSSGGNQFSSENNDYGYGGYKKGHSDVNANW